MEKDMLFSLTKSMAFGQQNSHTNNPYSMAFNKENEKLKGTENGRNQSQNKSSHYDYDDSSNSEEESDDEQYNIRVSSCLDIYCEMVSEFCFHKAVLKCSHQ